MIKVCISLCPRRPLIADISGAAAASMRRAVDVVSLILPAASSETRL
jgi:hypothetical protein